MLTLSNRGRNLIEIEFDNQHKVGQYPSHDFFGDGSFYILDVPGVGPLQHSRLDG